MNVGSRLAVAILAGLLAASCTSERVPGPGARRGADRMASGVLRAAAPPPLQLEDRQIIVAIDLVTPALRGRVARTLARSYDLELAGAFPLSSIDVHCIVYFVADDRDIATVIAEVAAHPGVRFVQRNQTFEGSGAEHSDPMAGFQYGADRMGAAATHQWTTGAGVRIAVVDTGVDTRHPDLAGAIRARRNFVEHGERSFERDEHGTSVTGLIIARPDNDLGIYGVAPGAEIVASKACWHPPSGGGGAQCSSWTIARAIDDAVRDRVRVINLSLGGPPDGLIEQLLQAADDAGIVVVAAAGDDGGPVQFPASLDTVIAAVASDAQGSVPSPPRNPKPRSIVAPGREILTTVPGGEYRFLSGSSLSSAYVTGAAALLLAYEPTLTPTAVAELLTHSAPTPGVDPAEARAASIKLRHLDACDALRRLSRGKACP